MDNTNYENQEQPVLNQFEEKVANRNKVFAIVGFIMSIASILICFLGFVVGVPLIVIEICFGIYGLRSKLKGLGIATIVLASLSAVIFILNYVLTILFVL